VKNYGLFNYSDTKVSLSKDWVGFTWTAAYVGTNAKRDVYRTVQAAPSNNVYDPSKGTLVVSMGKTF
jgi:hypothetical protein